MYTQYTYIYVHICVCQNIITSVIVLIGGAFRKWLSEEPWPSIWDNNLMKGQKGAP